MIILQDVVHRVELYNLKLRNPSSDINGVDKTHTVKCVKQCITFDIFTVVKQCVSFIMLQLIMKSVSQQS